VSYKKKTDLYNHAYQFEHEYLEKEMKRIRVTFGSKKIFKSQYTINTFKNDHQLWLKKCKQSRYNQMTISGRKDSGSGNFVFRYHCTDKILHFKTPSGIVVEIRDLLFPYGQEVVDSAISGM
jgi:hypothetical protein